MIAAAVLALAAVARPAPGVFATLTTRPGDPAGGPVPVTLARAPTAAEIARAFPRTATVRGTTLWRCGVRRDGGLRGCTLDATLPAGDPRYERAARRLLPRFRIAASSTLLAIEDHRAVLLTVPVERPGAMPLQDPDCHPPFCTPVLPPSAP